jgi:carboxylesterase
MSDTPAAPPSPSPSGAPILAGAEPFSAAGSDAGVLVVHGFTGTPQSMRPLAEAFAAAGFTVELPLLPGHGTVIEDMVVTGWDDWSAAAERAYQDLAARCSKVVVAGLSMGGTLAVWLTANHPEIAGLVAVNAMVDPPSADLRELLRSMLDAGPVMPGIGSDVADPDMHELAYDGAPVQPLLSMFGALDELAGRLGDIRCPVLIFTSVNDHVVAPVSSDVLAAAVSGPIERVTLERSFHVATIDYDHVEIERRSVEFAKKVTTG